MRRNLTLEERDRETFLHPYTSIAEHLEKGAHVFTEAKGIYVTDRQGKRFIDGFAGMGCVNAGFGRKEIADAIAEQTHRLAWYHTLAHASTEPTVVISEKILELAPDNMARVFLTCSGSEANDTQVRLVWYYNYLRGKPEKRKIISVKQGYHGATVIAACMTGVDLAHDGFGLPLDGFLYTDCPHYYWNGEPGESERDFAKRLAKNLDDLIEREGPDTVAAFILEPVLGGGGSIVPPEGYFEEIPKVLKKHDVLFIDDEVVCGFGRLGRWLGCYRFGFEPDLISIAKGLTSAYYPMSGAIISQKIWDVMVEGSPKMGIFGHGNTYNGHPTGAAAALANIDLMERERLIDNADKVGDYLGRRLHEEFDDHPLVGEVRGVGLLHAVELVADKKNKKGFAWDLNISEMAYEHCSEHGLIMHVAWPNTPACNSLLFAPPICITKSEVDDMVARFGAGLQDLSDRLVREGIWNG
jgi:L-2,4-diaminobutyrate transaminase